MKITYLFPITAALLILLFYLGLPDLKNLPQKEDFLPQGSHWTRRDSLFLSLLTLVYAAVAFSNLGDMQAPQTVRSLDGESAVVTLDGEYSIDRAMIYTGIGQGSYTFEYSADGEKWYGAAYFEQGHAALLKWQELDLEDAPNMAVRYVRICGTGAAEIGEVALFNAYGELLPISSDCPELCDEQALIPAEATYLNSSYFDEIYHARTAWEHLRGIYPYEVSHPPLGKLILSLGIALFGMTPFGWRFMGTLFGVLMLPVLYVFAKKLFGGRLAPSCCAVIFAADFMHFTQTRIATIDTYAVFFILLMYLFMWLFVCTDRRRYLALSGLFFGLGAASKWTCLYAGAGLAVIWLLYWIRRLAGAAHDAPCGEALQFEARDSRALPPVFRCFAKNILFCLLFFVLIPCTIYYLSYYPYALAKGISSPLSAGYAKIVLDNQNFMFTYHSGVTAEHPYSSRWYQWVLDIRPILYYLKYYSDGSRSSFGAWLNPILCWAGLLALFVLGYMFLFRRDKKAGFLLLGYLAQLVPWMFITRITFEYHYFPSSVFLVLALGYVFSLMERVKEPGWKGRILGLTALCAAVFVLFYPALSGARVDNATATRFLQWLPTWPF